MYDYVTELERQGLDNHVVTMCRKNAQTRPFEKVYEIEQDRSRGTRGNLLLRIVRKLGLKKVDERTWPRIRKQLGKVVDQVQPDIIHAHFGGAGVMISPVSQECGIPLVTTFYGRDISAALSEPAWRSRYTKLWTSIGAVTVLSENMKARAESLGCPANKVHVVHLARAIDIALTPDKKRKPVQRLLSVGRLVEKKGFEDAVNAVSQASRNRADLELDIVGEGELRPQLEAAIKLAEVEHRVRLHGAVPETKVIEMMRTADAFILCSKTASNGDEEGTPTVLIEAQALNLPCISTLHSGIPEVIARENHRFLAPQGDVQAIADRIELLTRQSPAELDDIVANGRKHVAQNFDLQREAQKLATLYESLQSESP